MPGAGLDGFRRPIVADQPNQALIHADRDRQSPAGDGWRSDACGSVDCFCQATQVTGFAAVSTKFNFPEG